MDKKIIIAIDGYSSTGKSTVAKQLAKHYSYVYVDTGAMYRAVALYAIENSCIVNDNLDKELLVSQLENVEVTFKFNETLGFSEVHLNGVNVESKIRGIEVSSKVSIVAAVSEVRKKLVQLQQAMGQHKGVVMDGRDIATVVFPDAEVKLFMTASAETRAQRRYDELIAKGDTVTYQEVLENVTQRDLLDTTRKDAPLVKADTAIEIDNSNLTREEQYQKIIGIVDKALA